MDADDSRSDHETDLTALECRLSTWRPAAGTLSRDRMLFDAGRAAAHAEGRGRFWPLLTAASIVVAVSLGGLLAHERVQRVAFQSAAARSGPRDVNPPVPSSVMARIEAPGPNSYLALNSRLAKRARNSSSLDVDLEAEPRRPPAASSESSPYSGPLRPVDVKRVLDL